MRYAVLVGELRAAAGDYESVETGLGSTPVVIDHADPGSLGHVELAAWLVAVSEQCGNAHTALREGAGALAGSLRASATDYEATDDQVGGLLTSPFIGPTFGASPFGGPTPAPPAYGPPVPGTGAP